VTAAEHEDPLYDAIALVELAGSGDEAAARAILRNCDSTAVTARLARLLAALVNENVAGNFVCAECFRAWAAGQ
jgi:hypothetical protein